MKKLLSIFFAATAMVGGMTSCSDFLDEDNKTGETADLAYQTVTGIDGLVSSAYAYTRGWWGKEPSLGLSEMGSDLFYYGYDNKQKSLCAYDISPECYGFGSTSGTNAVNDNHCLDQYWELFYAGIDVCNNTIKYVPGCNAITPEKKDAYLGDAYFLRALYYSQMVAIWGPIPYNSEALTSTNSSPVRVPEAEVYKNILDDLKTSMEKFKSGNVMKSAQATGLGRATYYSAEALFARVALYAASWLGPNSIEGYGNLYEEAMNKSEDVINKSGADMYDRYTDTWNLNYEEANVNKENLFAVHYGQNVSGDTENCVPYRFAVDKNGNHEQFNSLLTRTGYSRGGSAMNLMFVSLWNNGASDLGGSGNKNTCVFQRVTTAATGLMPSKKTGANIDCAAYYSPYGRGFTRYVPSLYLWSELDKIKGTDQRYNGTMLCEYNCPAELADNAAKYPKMGEQVEKPYAQAYSEDGNYFNGGIHAIVYAMMDGNSEKGKELQAEAKDKYRIQFAFGGDIPVYTSGDMATAVPTEGGKAISDVYGDNRYSDAKIEGRRSFPGIKKFLDDQVNETYSSLTYDISPRDIMVLRIAEMYLIKAEAQMMLNQKDKAMNTLNDLRARRAIPGKKTENTIQAVYKETEVTIDAILRERALELCGEFQRWFDLKRTHKLIEYVKARNAQASKNIALKHYYRPIPAIEFEAVQNRGDVNVQQDANGVMQYKETATSFWQNPGY